MASEAMSDERLAEINQLTADVIAGRICPHFDEETAWLAILDLRREVERQRAPTQSYYQMLEQRLSDKGDEVERLRAVATEAARHVNEALTDIAQSVLESGGLPPEQFPLDHARLTVVSLEQRLTQMRWLLAAGKQRSGGDGG